MLPLLLGVAPFGMIFGVVALASGIPRLETQGFSLFVFAGSAQFIAAGLIGDGAAPLIVVLTILVVNLRHMLYSASMAPHVRHLSARWKIALAWLLTDEAFATTWARQRKGDTAQVHWFALGTGLTLWATWQASTALGVALGAVVPEGLALDFVLPLTFLALLLPMLTERPALAAALSAGVLSVALADLPHKIGLMLATVVGVGVGLGVELLRSDADPAEGGER